jgi:hypothetical protein
MSWCGVVTVHLSSVLVDVATYVVLKVFTMSLFSKSFMKCRRK